jgi:metal-responsive CopG/Arc/MetJ family transcriptional regulator
MAEDKDQINTQMETELVEKLDTMCAEDENNRSQFIRKLIRQEWARRHQMVLPLDKAKAEPKRKPTAVAA